ncbi:alpha/beta hydrolase [Roseiconus nitratireducens]|uniref:Alpha/beta hydrolase n=1 Tax=Roseiconus nitratireducens TaxID=2605748 RepID=A0A5M6D9J8_9BACT|nr:alpha/beta fold hydrolase [Roseiconus nitratireducens]KAA5543100.1 alpha/beta hydrolase [Roseiconus nitratireducens]
MRILFLHGWHSIVGGVKPTYLIDHGHQVTNPALDDDDFSLAVQSAQEAYSHSRPEVIVGSSRGGSVAMNMESSDTPLVLLCPAWKNWGPARRVKSTTVILHSRRDDVIPFEDSVELITASGLPQESLIEVGTDHRLAEPEPLAAMLAACEAWDKPSGF